MEENIHDDKLDDYVRQSFEGFEEDPSLGMWQRIEGELLPSAEIAAPRSTYLRYTWQAMAAVVILLLLSTLVCEHLYYEEKLRGLTAKPVEQAETATKNNPVVDNIGPSDPSKKPDQDINPASILPGNHESADKNHRNTNSKNPPPAGNQRRVQVGEPKYTARNFFGSKSEITAFLDKHDSISQNPPIVAQVKPTQETEPLLPMTESRTVQQNLPNHLQIFYLPILPQRIETPDMGLPRPSPIFIKPLREISGWYVGAQTSLMVSREKSRTPPTRPGRPAFSSKQENSRISTLVWIKTGKQLNNRFLLETGLGYQKIIRTAMHRPSFRFADGTHHGHMGTTRDYNYDLSTYGGTAEVSLRMETTPGAPPADNAPVSLQINTTEQTEIIRLPVLAGYRFGKGRFQAQLKAGVLGNFILKNELDISARFSKNSRFEPVPGRDGYTVKPSQGKFFLGYWLSGGGEFKINRNISLLAEAALMGDFQRTDKFKQALPKQFSFGLNVGANYYF